MPSDHVPVTLTWPSWVGAALAFGTVVAAFILLFTGRLELAPAMIVVAICSLRL